MIFDFSDFNFDEHSRKMNDGYKDNLIEHTNYRKGDTITLNIPEIDRVREGMKNGTIQPTLSGRPRFADDVEEKFRSGETATVTSVMNSINNIFFKFDDGLESGQDQRWFKKVKKTK